MSFDPLINLCFPLPSFELVSDNLGENRDLLKFSTVLYPLHYSRLWRLMGTFHTYEVTLNVKPRNFSCYYIRYSRFFPPLNLQQTPFFMYFTFFVFSDLHPDFELQLPDLFWLRDSDTELGWRILLTEFNGDYKPQTYLKISLYIHEDGW